MQVFEAAEVLTITGYERDTACSHCGRALKLGVRVANFGGCFGADCLAKSVEKMTVGSYTFRLKADSIKDRAIIAHKGADYAMRQYGWDVDGANFRLTLKTPLKSI